MLDLFEFAGIDTRTRGKNLAEVIHIRKAAKGGDSGDGQRLKRKEIFGGCDVEGRPIYNALTEMFLHAIASSAVQSL